MRVSLRAPSFEDVDKVTRCMQDAETVRWLSSIPVPYSREDAIDFVGRSALASDRCILVDGQFAGMIRTGADLGYWVAPEFRGRGVARNAAQLAMMQYFQQSTEPAKAWHFIGNDVSRRVLLSVGFRDVEETVMNWQGDIDMPAKMMRLTARDMLGALEIRTGRCRINALRDADMPELHRIVTSPQVARMLLRFAPGQTQSDVDALIRPAMNTLHRPMRLAVRHEGRFIGTIGVNDGPSPMIFYFLAPEVAGRGIASEIVPAFCDTVQDWFGLDDLSAVVFTDNPASRRVLEKAGFAVEFENAAKSAGREGISTGWHMRRHQAGSPPQDDRAPA